MSQTPDHWRSRRSFAMNGKRSIAREAQDDTKGKVERVE
jgi:hypothetical protein